MERWRGKVAVITGTSSGIGLSIAKTLIGEGMIVVGLARRKEKMEELMKDARGSGQFHAKECDITKEENVLESLDWVKSTLGSVNVLVNNAGAMTYNTIEDTPTSTMEHTIQVNLLGPLYCAKKVINLMKENQQEGHIININSMFGHKILPAPCYIPFNIYPATKFALTALSEILSTELIATKIRVTNISPGVVNTNLRDKMLDKNEVISKIPTLEPEDIANSVVHALSAPKHVEIKEIMLAARAT